MNIFITGGTGFIGSNFIERALKKNFKVTALKRNNDSNPSIKLSNEPTWLISSIENIKASQLKDFDVIIHLASAGVSPKKCSWNELSKTNILDSFELIKKANNAGCKRIIISGTAFEYGYSANLFERIPINAPLIPLTLYGASKVAGFYKLYSYALNNEIEFYYPRIFSVYGHGQYHKNFWPSLYNSAVKGDDFKMTNGDQIRDFIHIDDVVSKLIEGCLRKDLLAKKPLVENIGTGRGITLKNFAISQWLKFAKGGELLFGEINERENEIQRLVALIDENKNNLLNLKNTISTDLNFVNLP